MCECGEPGAGLLCDTGPAFPDQLSPPHELPARSAAETVSINAHGALIEYMGRKIQYALCHRVSVASMSSIWLNRQMTTIPDTDSVSTHQSVDCHWIKALVSRVI